MKFRQSRAHASIHQSATHREKRAKADSGEESYARNRSAKVPYLPERLTARLSASDRDPPRRHATHSTSPKPPKNCQLS